MQYDNDLKYGEASLKVREKFSSKIKTELNKNTSDSGMRLIKLINIIPNWETYLTEKQLESTKKYLMTLNAYEVDYQLRLNSGTTHQRLFGSKKSKGALGRLEQVYKILEKQGYFEEQRKKQEEINDKNQIKKKKLSQKTIQSVKELLSFIIDHPDYEKYLTKSQIEKVYHFIRLRSFAGTARQCGISQDSLKTALIGKDGVLERLQKVYSNKIVNSWEEL